jgi:transcription elongation factor GreA
MSNLSRPGGRVAEQVTSDQELNLQEAISRYVRSLADGKPDVAAEVTRFGRWFGGERMMRSLRPADIERYGEETSKNPVDASRRLESVRGFLAYAKKQGITESNLATHLRLRRTGSGDSSGDAAASDRIEVSVEGLAALQGELSSLTSRRPEIAEELRLAMADKDFRENAPLDAAREKQAHLEARIRELEATLKRAVVIESSHESTGRARMGSKITLLQLDTNQEKQYVLVGPGEVNAGQGRISVQSPVGRAVLNRGAGEEVEVTVPAGVRRFRIEAVES